MDKAGRLMIFLTESPSDTSWDVAGRLKGIIDLPTAFTSISTGLFQKFGGFA
jgi:hypothetical protein